MCERPEGSRFRSEAETLLSVCLVAVCVLLLVACRAGNDQTQRSVRPSGELTVFAASSLTELFEEIGQRLETDYPGLTVVYNFAGSSVLRMQLEQGAQADLVACADAEQMALAQRSGVVQGEARIFVRNTLTVIVPKGNPGKVREFRDLAKPGLKLAVAGSQVPAGNYSRQIIRRASVDYGAEFLQRVLANVVSEEGNVKQVVAKVQLGEADAGFVYLSDVTPRVRGVCWHGQYSAGGCGRG